MVLLPLAAAAAPIKVVNALAAFAATASHGHPTSLLSAIIPKFLSCPAAGMVSLNLVAQPKSPTKSQPKF